jgi:hypothetical protein
MKLIFINKLSIIFCFTILNTTIKGQNVNALTVLYDVTYPGKTPTFKSIYFNQCISYSQGSKILYKYLTYDSIISSSITNDCNEITYNSFPYKDDIQMKVAKNGLRNAFKLATPTVIVTDETKIILGLECVKVISESKNAVGTIIRNTYFISGKLDSLLCSSTSILGLSGWIFGCEPISYKNGILLEAEIDMGSGCTQIWKAKSIGYMQVDSSIFDIPEIAIITYDEYNQKISTDKKFRKEMMREIRNDKTAEFHKQVWAKLVKDFGDHLLTALETANGISNNMNLNNSNNETSITNTLNNANNEIDQMRTDYSTNPNNPTDNSSNNKSVTNSNTVTFNKIANTANTNTQSNTNGTTWGETINQTNNTLLSNPATDTNQNTNSTPLVESIGYYSSNTNNSTSDNNNSYSNNSSNNSIVNYTVSPGRIFIAKQDGMELSMNIEYYNTIENACMGMDIKPKGDQYKITIYLVNNTGKKITSDLTYLPKVRIEAPNGECANYNGFKDISIELPKNSGDVQSTTDYYVINEGKGSSNIIATEWILRGYKFVTE